MNRILIVDDEPYIVDSLFELVSEMDSYKLEIFRAYSAQEAIDYLTNTKMHVVLSDIKMPGMTGIELLKQTKQLYPDCKFLFLTGFTNFEYVQTAIRYGGVDYILKTEDEDVIIKAVEKAIEDSRKTNEASILINRAEKQIQLVQPLIKKEVLLNYLRGHSDLVSINKLIVDKVLSLCPRSQTILVLGRIDEINDSLNDIASILPNMEAVVEKILFDTCRFEMIQVSSYRFCLMIQPVEVNSSNGFSTYIQKKLAYIQKECNRLLKVRLSFVSTTELLQWSELPRKFRQLENIIAFGTGHQKELLLTDQQYEIYQKSSQKHTRKMLKDNKQLRTLITYLESGKKKEFDKLYQELTNRCESFAYPDLMEFYYFFLSTLMTNANLLQIGESMFDVDFYHKLENLDSAPRQQVFKLLEEKFNLLFEHMNKQHDNKTSSLINQLHQYIQENIAGDLSLGKLSEIVYLNPQYLCRVYKQETGIGLSEYIAEVRLSKAKELLRDSYLKVHEIALMVGFDSPAYFNRFFKKLEKITPLEYREMGNKHTSKTAR